MDGLRLIVDQRERANELLKALELLGMDIEIGTLPVGDYAVSDRLCIERKTISDFESSLVSGRLFEQIARLKDAYEFPVVIVEGSPDTFRMQRASINGAIAAIYVNYGVLVLLTAGESDTAQVIRSMAKHEQSAGAKGPSLKGAARAHSEAQFQEYVVGNLPGIGPKLAKALLKRFGTVKRIANAKPEQLAKVDKIGMKKAQRAHDILNRRYDGEP